MHGFAGHPSETTGRPNLGSTTPLLSLPAESLFPLAAHGLELTAAGSLEHLRHGLGQGHGVERLRDIADAAELLAARDVCALRARRQEQDRDLASLRVGRHFLGDGPAVD